MIVSWNWLTQYVPLAMSREELEHRLMMSGLNHEGTETVGDDLAIDLEVTSNRPDCLGHIGVAREIAVLWDEKLTIPPAKPKEAGPPVNKLVRVRIDCPELCFRYTARVVRGVKIGPSPDWMVRRLATLGIAPINNVVDISNYVLMECGQPLHTFDFAKLAGGQIIVREPSPGETIEAIDHKTYRLEPGTCVIADAKYPVAIGGVMGGAVTEISDRTTDILVEAAEFDPLAIRGAARGLNLHSDSSYRFERRVDPGNIDWASRRCCELILELAGGTLAGGVVDVGPAAPARKTVVLRLAQIPRVLGIDVPAAEVRKILTALGNVETRADAKRVEVIPPSWRRDLTREIDLIEEVARIHGYDRIPQDVGVPMVASARRPEDRVMEKVRGVLVALGYDEAMTLSVVDDATSAAMSPWTDAAPLVSRTPVIRGADRLRRSLIPSLLAARRTNQALANPEAELFEIAKVYLPRGKELPNERRMLALTSGRSFHQVKGAIEAVLAALDPAAQIEAVPAELPLLAPERSCQLELAGRVLGFLGEISAEGLKQFELRQNTTVAELATDELLRIARLIPRFAPLPAYPGLSRDLNLVVDETVRWADVAATVRTHCEPYFEHLQYVDTYRDPKRLGPGKKSLLMALALRWRDGTLTNQEADRVRDEIVAACRAEHGAELRA
ncbi:MAG: phenylalanine--tRNA ligase subunit beta [Pirellulales bacterium]|nr:phenylalanine--tRNA ligase subunit beta [Pirellulales bacterium]